MTVGARLAQLPLLVGHTAAAATLSSAPPWTTLQPHFLIRMSKTFVKYLTVYGRSSTEMAKMNVEVRSMHTFSVENHQCIRAEQRRTALRRVEMELDEGDEMACIVLFVPLTG